MAYKQMGLVDLISAIQNKVEERTGIRCYDAVPINKISPFYYAEVVGKRPAHSKTLSQESPQYRYMNSSRSWRKR